MEIKKQANGSSEDQKEKTEKVEEQTKKLIDTHLEKVQKEIQSQIDEIEKRFQSQIEEQYEVIKKELLIITNTATKIEGMENRLQALVEKERGEIKKELSLMNASKRRIEDELGDKLSDKWDIVVKLRRNCLYCTFICVFCIPIYFIIKFNILKVYFMIQ